MHGLWSSPLLTKGFVRRGRCGLEQLLNLSLGKMHVHTCLRELLCMLCIVIGSLGRNLVVNFNSFKIHRKCSSFSESIQLCAIQPIIIYNNNNDIDYTNMQAQYLDSFEAKMGGFPQLHSSLCIKDNKQTLNVSYGKCMKS